MDADPEPGPEVVPPASDDVAAEPMAYRDTIGRAYPIDEYRHTIRKSRRPNPVSKEVWHALRGNPKAQQELIDASKEKPVGAFEMPQPITLV